MSIDKIYLEEGTERLYLVTGPYKKKLLEMKCDLYRIVKRW